MLKLQLEPSGVVTVSLASFGRLATMVGSSLVQHWKTPTLHVQAVAPCNVCLNGTRQPLSRVVGWEVVRGGGHCEAWRQVDHGNELRARAKAHGQHPRGTVLESRMEHAQYQLPTAWRYGLVMTSHSHGS